MMKIGQLDEAKQLGRELERIKKAALELREAPSEIRVQVGEQVLGQSCFLIFKPTDGDVYKRLRAICSESANADMQEIRAALKDLGITDE